jgi:hypothetical protein
MTLSPNWPLSPLISQWRNESLRVYFRIRVSSTAFTRRSHTDWKSFPDPVIEENRALQANAGGLSDLLEDCLAMYEATDEPMAIDKDGHLVAQALTASIKMKE